MPKLDRPRVLLVWPGALFGSGGNFGVPQLLSIARVLEHRTDAIVEVVDLDAERAFGQVDLRRIVSGGYDVVGVSCYSSFDFLKVMALAARLRELLPRAWFVTGGYHPSARPEDFTGEGSPFDYVVVGDGENGLARLVTALARGQRPLVKTIGPESVANPSECIPYRWELLEKYRPIARKAASQAEIYLSRGCPYDCAFCMEQAKRDTSWRALEPGAAVEELHRLDRFLDLSSWSLFVADALFGMKRTWRRAFLEELARRPIRAIRTWLLIRIDLIEKEDLELMSRARVSPGFGLESGDTSQLKRIRKVGKLDGYLDKMLDIAEWCRELDVPFGANVIAGHPGETEETLRASAAYMRKLFLDERGTHGFLSVDPFRLYPGSPIDENRADWEAKTGFKAHHYPWWRDGDQDFLAEWVDPSGTLDFRNAHRLRQELFTPILREIPRRFSHVGPAREYFMGAIREQVALTSPERTLRTLGLHHLWTGLLRGASPSPHSESVTEDQELEDVARAARRKTIGALAAPPSPALRDAIERVPRERFVRSEDIEHSAEDAPLALRDDGLATVSALHAYVASLDALSLAPGDHVVDLGAGTGYGAALASELVGPEGSVLAVEFDAALAQSAKMGLATYAQVRVEQRDAHETALWQGAEKVTCGFALASLPPAWIDALADGGQLVAPIAEGHGQTLTLFAKQGRSVTATRLGAVAYVPDRSALGAGDPSPTVPTTAIVP